MCQEIELRKHPGRGSTVCVWHTGIEAAGPPGRGRAIMMAKHSWTLAVFDCVSHPSPQLFTLLFFLLKLVQSFVTMFHLVNNTQDKRVRIKVFPTCCFLTSESRLDTVMTSSWNCTGCAIGAQLVVWNEARTTRPMSMLPMRDSL